MKYGLLTGPQSPESTQQTAGAIFGDRGQGKGNARDVGKIRDSFFMLFPSHAAAQGAISREGSAPAALSLARKCRGAFLNGCHLGVTRRLPG